ncbi:hypothetical protein HJG60_011568 [Phyllostomus discolor]|uniref:Murine leukemia virus integrase C-terminal domain-containing protein n=1 Tax=Phyllostomus discolor TaxID=89673 RepID=A0A833ZN01_9CHIR|nr:hypothetical protein HJG60_011568 [Phyllostomus discolor]
MTHQSPPSPGNCKTCACRGLTSDILPCCMVVQRWPNIANIARTHPSHQQLKAAYPPRLLKEPRPPPGLKPGDFICQTRHQRKATLGLCWKGPYQVLLTNSVVKLQRVNSLAAHFTTKEVTQNSTRLADDSKNRPQIQNSPRSTRNSYSLEVDS